MNFNSIYKHKQDAAFLRQNNSMYRTDQVKNNYSEMVQATMKEAEKVRQDAAMLEEKERIHITKLQETYNREKSIRDALNNLKMKVNKDITGGQMIQTQNNDN